MDPKRAKELYQQVRAAPIQVKDTTPISLRDEEVSEQAPVMQTGLDVGAPGMDEGLPALQPDSPTFQRHLQVAAPAATSPQSPSSIPPAQLHLPDQHFEVRSPTYQKLKKIPANIPKECTQHFKANAGVMLTFYNNSEVEQDVAEVRLYTLVIATVAKACPYLDAAYYVSEAP
jgi:hypothetical protein